MKISIFGTIFVGVTCWNTIWIHVIQLCFGFTFDMNFFGFVENQFCFGVLFDFSCWIRIVGTVFGGATCWKTIWVIQCERDLFGAFVNDESIVGNASLFFGVKRTKTLCFATNA